MHKAWAGVVGLALAGAAAWQGAGRGAQPAGDLPSSVQATGTGGAVGAQAAQLGRQRRMAVHLSALLQQPGAAQPLTVTVQGHWLTTVAAVRPGERDVACRLEGVRVSGSGMAQVPQVEREALERRLGRRFWVTYGDDGSVASLHWPRDVLADDRNLLQLLVTQAAFVRPAQPVPHWTATERDGAGTYLATYQRLVETGLPGEQAAGQPGVLVKRKLRYFNADVGAPAVAIAVTAAEWRFTLGADGEVLALQGSERLRIAAPIGPPAAATSPGTGHLDLGADIRLTAAGETWARAEIGGLERERGTLDSVPVGSQAVDPEVSQAARDQRLLTGLSAADLLDPRRDRQADPLLPARLAALLRRQPDAIPAALQRVRQAGGDSLVTGALGSAGTPAALAALGTLARDRAVPRQARIDALNALLRRSPHQPGRQPGARLEVGIAAELLDEEDAEVRRAARLVYGGLAHALAEVDPAGRAAIERALLARYPQATPGERADLLDALGNSAGPQILAPAVAALTDPDAEVRSAAAGALGRVEDPAADRVLADHLRREGDARVRLAVVRAAAERWPDRPTPQAPPRSQDDALVAVLLHALAGDPSEAVRAAAVSLLRRHQDAGPEIGAALTRAAATDPSPGVRRLAAERVR